MSSSNGDRRSLRVGIVGAGFGGIGAGVKLREDGHEVTIFERGSRVGGVWNANTYPGLCCDVPSHLYSFSFAPGHEWSRRYAPGPEIQTYLEGVVARFGLGPHIQLDTEVTTATFDEESGSWTLELADGSEQEFDLLVTACGQLSEPKMPAVPGLD